MLLLRDLAEEYGAIINIGIIIPLFLTHSDIAALISSSRQTVTSLLSDLENSGHIIYNRNRLLLKDKFLIQHKHIAG
ncbi:winged helix-turn-helix domain-containing protein [Labilibacter sediminis]|nr:winged helix-turn-helix domain-containing protein [Labilibacter sediminis]